MSDDKSLVFTGEFSGNGETATLNSTGNLSFQNTTLVGDASLTVNGGSIGFSDFSGPHTLTLDGTYDVRFFNSGRGRLGATILNNGNATLRQDLTGDENLPGVWRNANGASLTITDTGSLQSSFSGPGSFFNNAGSTLRATGTNASTVTWHVVNNGSIEVSDDKSLVFTGEFSGNGETATLNSTGNLSFQNTTLVGDASLTVNGGSIGFADFSGPHTLTLDGTYDVRFFNSGRGRLGATILNNGNATLQYNIQADDVPAVWHNTSGATLTIGDTGAFTVSGSAGGTLINDEGGVLATAGANLAAQNWDLVNSGTIRPGSSPGRLQFTGTTVLNSSSNLEIEIFGTNTSDYDRLILTGPVTLGGRLTLQVPESFVPGPSDTFEIISGTNNPLNGAFAFVAPGDRVIGSNGATFVVDYGVGAPSPGSVTLTGYIPVASDLLSNTVVSVSGVAEGGRLQITLNGSVIQIDTFQGESAISVIENLATAVNELFPGSARAVDNVLEVLGFPLEGFVTDDQGLAGPDLQVSDVPLDEVQIPIPIWAVVLLLLGLTIVGRRQVLPQQLTA